MRLLTVPSELWNKTVIHRFISQDSILMQVLLDMKMADLVKKRSISVKGNNMSKGTAVMVYTLRLWGLNMRNKWLWSSKKMQHLLRQMSKGGNMEIKTHQFYEIFFFCTDLERMEYHYILLHLQSPFLLSAVPPYTGQCLHIGSACSGILFVLWAVLNIKI
jgi:hypothetical protein